VIRHKLIGPVDEQIYADLMQRIQAMRVEAGS
jgi:hypothetical protein